MSKEHFQGPTNEVNSPEWKRRMRIRRWTIPSPTPKLNSLIIKGKLVEFDEILGKESVIKLPPRDEMPPPLIIKTSAEDQKEISDPVSIDFSMPNKERPKLTRLTERDSNICEFLATAIRVRTFSQINDGAEIGYYSPSVRRDFPQGVESDTLPRPFEVVRKLLADHLGDRDHQDIEVSTRLREDLGVIGTTLSTFEDELEYLGFKRPNLDLAAVPTVGDIIKRLDKQKEVIEGFMASVVFPKTKTFFYAKKEFDRVKDTTEPGELEIHESWEANFFNNLTRSNPKGELRFEQQLGVPVITCEEDADFQALRPIAKRPLFRDVQAYSFVVTRENRLYPSGEEQPFPLIVRRCDCPDQVILQHARTQLAFARKINPDVCTPVLVSRSALSLEEYIPQVAENRVLANLVLMKEPIQWELPEKRGNVYPSNKDLFDQYSWMSLRPWLRVDEKILGRSKKRKITEAVISETNERINIISRMVKFNPSVEFQNFVANWLSLFPDWEKAEKMFNRWDEEKRNAFADSITLRAKRDKSIFRTRSSGS